MHYITYIKCCVRVLHCKICNCNPHAVAAAQLKAPTDTSKLKKHIALLCERLGKGGKLIISAENKASNR